ncbi:MAG: RNA polymerase factor sigma-54 [Beijerinckiaceae bacterium]|jgi:RNA polymerase sigma-54 factor|nr:RNA polymerase factor sigma-54 [Beijerinckiaceae bacterium]
MAIAAKLMMRQGQSLVMTPQLLQAIKLLQLSSQELSAYVEQELERNPLLERADDSGDPGDVLPDAGKDSTDASFDDYSSSDGSSNDAIAEQTEGDWARENLEVSASSIEDNLGTEISNTFDADTPAPGAQKDEYSDSSLSATSWTGTGGQAGGEAPNLEAYVAAEISLAEHLNRQLAIAVTDPTDLAIGQTIIDSIDETGYMREPVDEMAERLGTSTERLERILLIVQTFDPVGVGARDLAECLAIQLRERDRFDPAMAAMVANLPLLAKREFDQLRKICGVDQADIIEMIGEIRELDPKPGRAFGGSPVQPVTPDVTIRPAADGSWHIELNPEGLPRVLVNQTYAAKISGAASKEDDKIYIAECLQNANWLTRSLEQRARTILKVASEIVRQQDAFFASGIEHLRPLNLKTVADAIGMHESTISRVTSNKFMATHRGLFEFKYFFTAAIPSNDHGEAHSAESVRHRIKQLIDHEKPTDVLSDDAIVSCLKQANIDIARRTVAKYREGLRIPSSVQRRREKSGMLAMA